MRRTRLRVGPNAFVPHAREHARVDGGGDRRNRDAEIEGDLRRPAAGPLLPGLVEHAIDERTLSVRILHRENLRGDLDEERLERAAVVRGEGIGDLGSADNELPKELRANLISIGLWLLREAEEVRQGRSDNFEGLIEVSQIIRDGIQ